jgi:geranylgeranyl diphosphate synthase type II
MKSSPHPSAADDPAWVGYLAGRRRRIDRELSRRMRRAAGVPPTLARAMRYSLMAGGKRLRPILAWEACRSVGGKDAWVLPACCALEMIHTYSLIHDDLPAMDDDAWRRGRPTAHVQFGEAMAILSGDALHTLAFQVLAEEPAGTRFAARRARVTSEVARAAGVAGMVGGQVRDLESEGRRISPAGLARIHRGKTGALLTVALTSGGILGGARPSHLEALRRFGQWLGLAFQIVDDVLDEEGTRPSLGKSPGKDRAMKKATYPALFGVGRSRQMARRAVSRATQALQPLGYRAEPLVHLAHYILARDR